MLPSFSPSVMQVLSGYGLGLPAFASAPLTTTGAARAPASRRAAVRDFNFFIICCLLFLLHRYRLTRRPAQNPSYPSKNHHEPQVVRRLLSPSPLRETGA